jgi:Inovirus Gp2
LKHFQNNRRHNKLFDHMVGHIWALEYGVKKGYHYHLIFFLRGSEAQKDWYFSNQIGKYWEEQITQGRGNFHNCNANKQKYLHLGIGMIDATRPEDAELRVNLRNVVNYLTKNEQILMLKLGAKDKAFGKGRTPEANSNRGRPRKAVVLE